MKHVVIIGAGLAGLSTAYHLKNRQDCDCTVLESENSPGGLCRTVEKNGFLFDYTGHLIHLKNNYTKRLVGRLLKGNLKKLYRNSWIYSKDVYTPYPFQENSFGLPPEVARECILGFIKAVRNKGKRGEQSFQDWILNNFGEGIARHFMVPYNSKMWTCHPREMTSQWLGDYVPKPALRAVADGALFGRKSSIGYNAFFYYPKKGGIQVLADAFAAASGNLKLNTPVTRIDPKNRKVYYSRKGSKPTTGIRYDTLVSSMPLKKLILEIITGVPVKVKKAARGLKYCSVINVNLGVARKKISDKHWIYFPEDKYIFYRAGFLMNFSASLAPGGASSIYTEISYKPGKKSGILKDRKKTVKRVIGDLVKAGILRSKDKILTVKVLDIEYAYVIYDSDYQKNIRIIKDYLKKNGIHVVGRYGRWEYSAIEEAILEGKETAEEIEVKTCSH